MTGFQFMTIKWDNLEPGRVIDQPSLDGFEISISVWSLIPFAVYGLSFYILCTILLVFFFFFFFLNTGR